MGLTLTRVVPVAAGGPGRRGTYVPVVRTTGVDRKPKKRGRRHFARRGFEILL